MVRVVYIVGAGRSGSTFLDIALGNHSCIQSLGELLNLLYKRAQRLLCTCREPIDRCQVWSDVCKHWIARTNDDVLQTYRPIQAGYERVRNWPVLLHDIARKKARFKEYSRQTAALYESIAQVTGHKILVDSSKNPLRAYALSRMEGLDVRFIHLVRDARGVAWCYIRAPVKNENSRFSTPTFATAWNLQNLESNWVTRHSRSKALLVRYEDLVQIPRAIFTNIGQLIDCDLASVADLLVSGQDLAISHMAGGNNLRMSGTVKLKPDIEWTQYLPQRDRQTIWWISGWLLKRYGYQR